MYLLLILSSYLLSDVPGLQSQLTYLLPSQSLAFFVLFLGVSSLLES